MTSRLERDSNIASNDWPTSTCVKGLENSAQKLGLAPARRAEPKTPNSYERFPDHRRDRGPFFAIRGARTRFPDNPRLFPVLANKFPVFGQPEIRAKPWKIQGKFREKHPLWARFESISCNFPVKQGISVFWAAELGELGSNQTACTANPNLPWGALAPALELTFSG